jgi:hypothetical protein
MFYNKCINIYIEAEPVTDEYGIVRRGELELVDTLMVDVQPISKKIAQEEYGIETGVSWRIFSPLNIYILQGAYVEYRGVMYKILDGLLEWDDYIEFLVGDIDDNN